MPTELLQIAPRISRKIIILTAVNAFLVLAYFLFAYVPIADVLKASVLVTTLRAPPPPESITAVQAAPVDALDPVMLRPADHVAVGLAYEPLVRFDAFFNLVPALAYSWYWRDSTHLVTLLQTGAQFHDGSAVTCADVAATLARARENPASMLRDNFEGVTVVDEHGTCVFTLAASDQTFLQKLTQLYIIPHVIAEKFLTTTLTDVVGSGRYRLVTNEKNTLTFAAFAEYHHFDSLLPKHVLLNIESKKYNRLTLVREGKVDILLDTPAMFATQIEKRMNYRVTRVPTYESTFMLFNQHNDILKEQTTRAHLAAIIREIGIAGLLADESVYDLGQFAPSGVFGFNPALSNESLAKTDAFTISLVLTLGVTETNKKIAEILQSQLKSYNVEVKPQVVSDSELADALKKGSFDLYLLGWRYDLGTVDGFFRKLIHSPHGSFGELNGLAYRSPVADQKIESAMHEFDADARIKKWQDLMAIVVRDDVIGVPLLGTRQLYAVRPTLSMFTPRMDGSLLFESHPQ